MGGFHDALGLLPLAGGFPFVASLSLCVKDQGVWAFSASEIAGTDIPRYAVQYGQSEPKRVKNKSKSAKKEKSRRERRARVEIRD